MQNVANRAPFDWREAPLVVVETDIVGAVEVEFRFTHLAQFLDAPSNLAAPLHIFARRGFELVYEIGDVDFDGKIADVVGAALVVIRIKVVGIRFEVVNLNIIDVVIAKTTVHRQYPVKSSGKNSRFRPFGTGYTAKNLPLQGRASGFSQSVSGPDIWPEKRA